MFSLPANDNQVFWLGVPLAALGLVAAWYLRSPSQALVNGKKVSLRLARKEELSWDTRKYTFQLPTPQHVLGLPCGKHLFVSAMMDNPRTGKDKKYVARPYTPVSPPSTLGFVEIVVKTYFKEQHPHFPDGGWMSQYLNSLSVGAKVDFRGPTGKVTYLGGGAFDVSGKRSRYQRVGMVAGGTGITPMLQIMQYCQLNDDPLEMSLLYANKTPEDILLRDSLLDFDREKNVRVAFTVDKGDDAWTGYTGFVSRQMLEETLPPPGKDTVILLCGPPVMLEKCVMPLLEALGYENVQCL